MTERKYALKYDLSDGQTNLTAGNFSVWDGDDGVTYNNTGTYDLGWGTEYKPFENNGNPYDNKLDYNYDNTDPHSENVFDPTNFASLILAVGNYYFSCVCFNMTGTVPLDSFIPWVQTYIGKDGDDASGKNGTYITAVRVEAA